MLRYAFNLSVLVVWSWVKWEYDYDNSCLRSRWRVIYGYIITSMKRLFRLDVGQQRIDWAYLSSVVNLLVLVESSIINCTVYLYQ